MNKDRRAEIRSMLSVKPFISLAELEEKFPGVSSMTLRRDIEFFDSEGEAIKVRGGARSMKFITTSMEDSFGMRLEENTGAKELIARAALSFVEAGRSIFLDSGTTALKLASLMPDRRLNITTSGPNVALELSKMSQPVITLVGGMLNRENLSVSGMPALRCLSDINIDTAFLVPSGLSVENGFTSGNYGECELKRQICQKARRVVVLMDHSKLDKTLPYTFAPLSGVSDIITDLPLPEAAAEAARLAGVSVIVAGGAGT